MEKTKVKTVAKIKYRGWVSMWVIAIPYCNLTFYGVDKEKYEDLWRDIEYKKYNNNEEKRDLLEEKLEPKKNQTVWERIKYFFAKDGIQEQLDKLNHNSFYSATELYIKAEDFLEKYGFLLKSSSVGGINTTDETYIYEK